MIESINSLKGFGIFSNYKKNTEIKDFNKFNLIYGWNGSGKSTLSKVFECISKRKIISDFPDAELEIRTEDGVITTKNLSSANLDICVFNSNFIKENIDWDSTVKSILLISQEKIIDKQVLKDKSSQFKIDSARLENLTKQKQEHEDNKLKTLSTIAKNIKQRFEILDSADNYYVSYNRTKVQQKLALLEEKIDKKELLLSKDEFEKTKKSASPKFKESINHSFTTLKPEIFETAAKRLGDLLSKTATSSSIDFLKENPPIQSWVETGIKLHDDQSNCLFCENKLNSDRLKTLNEHFSEAFRELKDRLERASTWLSSNELPAQPALFETDFYEEFYQPIPTALEILLEVKTAIESSIQAWRVELQKKIENPFEVGIKIEEISKELISKYNDACIKINSTIDLHNIKSRNFKLQVDQAKQALENHFLTEEFHDSNYSEHSSETIKIEPLIENQRTANNVLSLEIQQLELSLSDEAIGAEKFNSLLHKFLGRNHIELKFDSTQKGYKIIRKPENTSAKNLSEGEKNAVGLIYFLTKLNENNRDIKDCIVVMDDPVSSFDSNNLFNTHSFLRSHCQAAKQLIILTHSFNYFKLARDWLALKNKKRDEHGKILIRSNFYHIDAAPTAPRASDIKNAPSSLLEHNSEYHYIFDTLRSYVDKQELNVDESFAVANMARKLLEAFLTFKFPDGRGDFNSLMSKAIKNEELRERIYRFINKYSHNQVIEFDNIGTDNVLHESQYIVRDIFTEIERLDKSHYDGMITSAQG